MDRAIAEFERIGAFGAEGRRAMTPELASALACRSVLDSQLGRRAEAISQPRGQRRPGSKRVQAGST